MIKYVSLAMNSAPIKPATIQSCKHVKVNSVHDVGDILSFFCQHCTHAHTHTVGTTGKQTFQNSDVKYEC